MPKPTPRSFFAALGDFKSGKDTPSAFLDRCLATLAEIEPQVLAFVHYDTASAREAASRSTARWRDGKPLSPIDGMPVAVKDIIETIDMPTEMGSALYKGWRSGRDAASVAALREAGAVVLGKTVTTEFATAPPGPTRNPWDLRRTPGGSSSGSAAAAGAGMVAAGLGTQVLGSILRPASFCGCVGFKPSLGAINRGGTHDGLSQSVHGALAASIEDAWITLREIADRAGGDPGYPGLFGPAAPPPAQKPRRLAVLETPGWAKAEPAAKAALEQMVERLAGAGVELRRRKDDPALDKVEHALERALPVSQQINGWETRWPLNTYRARDPSKLTQFSLDRLAEAERMTLVQYRERLGERAQIRAIYAALTPSYDAIVTLSATGPAPIGLASTGDPIFVVAGSLLGVPAISLPLLEVEGLPVGLQLLGFLDADPALIATALSGEEFARALAQKPKGETMHFRLSNGLSMAYHVRGAGRIVLFLHPIGTRAAFWDGVVERIADRYRCVTIDLPGHGDSDVPRQSFSLDDLADNAIELLRFERARGAIVVGCSLGGMVAQGIALKVPELLGGIVLADTGYQQTPEGRKGLQQRADDSLNGMPAMLEPTLTRWFPPRFLALNPPEVQACRAWLLDNDPVVFSWGWEAIRDLDYGERLKDIKLPALVLRGSADTSSQREAMQAMAKLLPNARYVEIENAGHVAPLEKPDPFAALLVEFIDRDAGR